MDKLHMRFTGEGMKPGKIRSKELADIIEAFEDMIVSLVIRDNPELKRETLVVGLVNITDDSLGLQFATNVTDLTIAAAIRVAEAIAALDFENLPSPTISAIKTIKSFVVRHNCEAEIKVSKPKNSISTVITSSTTIPSIPLLRGQTTLYGQITRVGGATPRVQFKTISNETLYCEVNQELARQLGSKLYTQVALSGDATWNVDTLEIEDFRIQEVLDYEETPVTQAFAELRKIVGSSFDQIEDVQKFATDIRRGLI